MRASPRHGHKLCLNDPTTYPEPVCTGTHELARYGHVEVQAFQRRHPQLDTRGGIADEHGRPVILENSVIKVSVQCLPGNILPNPMWLWVSKSVPEDAAEVDHWWSMYLRHFDLEHTFRFLKQGLGAFRV